MSSPQWRHARPIAVHTDGWHATTATTAYPQAVGDAPPPRHHAALGTGATPQASEQPRAYFSQPATTAPAFAPLSPAKHELQCNMHALVLHPAPVRAKLAIPHTWPGCGGPGNPGGPPGPGGRTPGGSIPGGGIMPPGPAMGCAPGGGCSPGGGGSACPGLGAPGGPCEPGTPGGPVPGGPCSAPWGAPAAGDSCTPGGWLPVPGGGCRPGGARGMLPGGCWGWGIPTPGGPDCEQGIG